jgi:hypothetical protein
VVVPPPPPPPGVVVVALWVLVNVQVTCSPAARLIEFGLDWSLQVALVRLHPAGMLTSATE